MKHRISPATAISLVALFFSLTGAGFTASRYLITSVNQIKPSVRHALRGATGPQGPQGVQGVAGPQGPAGTVDWSRTYLVSTNVPLSEEQPEATTTAACHPGDHVLNGGYGQSRAIITASQGQTDGHTAETGWIVQGHLEPSETTGGISAWLICVPS